MQMCTNSRYRHHHITLFWYEMAEKRDRIYMTITIKYDQIIVV